MNKYNYPIYFGKTSYKELTNYLINNISKIFIIVDKNTKTYCLPYFLNQIKNLQNFYIIEIPLGEKNKNIFTCIKIWKQLNLYRADRKSCLINLGGGMISDLGGFCASTFKRGINFINIPTTLLGMVDAALGGKTGINLEEIKNAIGTFQHPKLLLIDSQYINSLSQKEIFSGFMEVIKHALIYDKKLWIDIKNILLNNILQSSNLEKFIHHSIRIKHNIVEKDPKEIGLRKILNFGHTIGHGIETFFMNTTQPLLHGEAIALGIIFEAWISYKNEFLSIEEYNEIFFIIKNYYPLKQIKNIDLNQILLIMECDKKNENEKISFSLLNGIGNSLYGLNIEKNIIQNYLLECIKYINKYISN